MKPVHAAAVDMRKPRTRKDFLKLIGLGIMSVMSVTFFGNFIRSKKLGKSTSMLNSSIKNISPMGFQWETEDPFLFCVHHEDFYPEGNAHLGPTVSLKGRNIGQDFQVKDGFRMYHGERIPGFPSHPHRGFETVTVVRNGYVDHSDSMGAVGRYSSGDVQWMTAGSGLQHSEMFPLLKSDSSNTLELFQIWLNLPKRNKLVNPHFTMLWNEMIPKIIIKDGQKEIKVELIAGKLNGISAPPPPPDSWAFDEHNFVSIWIITMEAGSKWNLPKNESGLNRNLYFFKGSSVKVADKDIAKYNKISLYSDMETLLENTSETEISFLFLQARPIQEPVVQYGPFVMNTREEIESTFREYQVSQFGGWPYDTSEPVHGREKGRFAKHADGRDDLPPV